MKFIVYKGDNQLGPFSAREIQGRLDNGSLFPTDLAWYEGAPDWMPIYKIGEVNTASSNALTASPNHLSLPLPTKKQLSKDNSFNPVNSGWFCLILAVLGMVFIPLLFIPVALVLGFVVFVLCIVALSKGKVAGGAVLLCALVFGMPIAIITAPFVRGALLKKVDQAKAQDIENSVVLPSGVTNDEFVPLPPLPTPHAFLADVKYSQQAAVAKYPDLGRSGSAANLRFVTRYKSWQAAHDPRLDRSDWPERLADDCAAHP